ncbi:MAG: aminotransferase class III-fold pyridoxal phosphate-dependent enzyme [Bdellovibrionales bacterium]|nr:aminotransferase class III-fold pyridoxal phosphate-dependent enzyme [Bdellovibrionales bacterium]
MKLPIINSKDSEYGGDILKKYYADNMIPAEKKTYLTRLRHSIGPYMGIEASDGTTHYMLDAASQIATLGHGFNTSIFFGAAEFLESWINDATTKEFKDMKASYINFFNRKLGWKKTHMTLTHSGAEANETALGYCYETRAYQEANKVLAFEGSFHGRMMVTLAATWNKSKREPFEWKNYLAEYVKYPEIDDAKINVRIPELWRETWNEASLKNFMIPSIWNSDPVVKKEIDVLLQVRSQLLSKKIFAILVEPMQCEGGDCYSSDRFHTALILMAKTFKVPVIHDEVQTGFHLGREFFWHRQFNLKGLHGEQINPDYVVCAKKAQVGIVLSHRPTKQIFKGEEFSVASALRGYAHAISLDQCQPRILDMERQIVPRVNALIKKHSEFIKRPRVNGLAFAFDVVDPTMMNKFVDLRFKHGLLYYPAGNQTLRFRMSTAFGTKDLDFLFDRLDAICRELFLHEHASIPTHVETDASAADEHYEWHELLIQTKLSKALGQKIDIKHVFDRVNALVSKTVEAANLELVEINASNFLTFRQDIINMQKAVYEPARQTDIEKFEHTVLDKSSLCLGLLNKKKKLMGIAFAGPLSLYPLERGVRMDPHYDDPDCLYMLDVTIDPQLQKSGLGRALKYAISAMAIVKGIKRIQGRNRDRLAGAMININLSLGSVEQNYIREDYPDFESHRDVFYYTTKADWKKPTTHLSRGISMPISIKSLDKAYFDFQIPYLVNKVCLSNFVSEPFLKGVRDFISVLPEDLRHGYTTSGQSECVDKVAKAVWVKSDATIKEKNINKMLTFKGHYFGNGSMLARSLSLESAPYFNVTKLPNPTEVDFKEILKLVEKEFETKEYLAVWIEPVLQKSMDKVPHEFLRGLRELSTKYSVALIFNETASQFFRYSTKFFMASCIAEITPDAGMIYFSGQSGMAYTSSKYFLEQPLMMISTWDGDEFHFLTYYHAFKNVMTHTDEYRSTMKAFHEKLADKLSRYDIDSIKLDNGFGHFKGSVPSSVRKMFVQHNGHYIVCPSYDAMKEYLES